MSIRISQISTIVILMNKEWGGYILYEGVRPCCMQMN